MGSEAVRNHLQVAAYALSLAAITALTCATLAAGRSLPWEADRVWAATFVASFLLSVAFWWRFGREAESLSVVAARARHLALGWGSLPLLPGMVATLSLIYLSDHANEIFQQPGWRPLTALSLGVLLLGTRLMQVAATEWLRDGRTPARRVVSRVLARRADLLVLASLIVVGVLQAVASVSTTGDDIGHYVSAADALLARRSYPLDPVAPELIAAGMAPVYPAVPFFPLLLAVSFSLFGHTVLAVAIPNVVATAAFPVVFYLACKSLTGARTISYAASVALALFPLFQIHFLGVPEADTTFEVLLLSGVVFAGKASKGGSPWSWAGMGLMLGLSALTRPEGLLYSVVILAPFFAFFRLRGRVWLALLTELLVLAPYALTIYGRTGSPWPTTFGSGSMALQNVLGNSAVLDWPAIPWYGQALGVGSDLVGPIFGAFLLASGVGAALLLRDKPALVGVPLAGLGNMVMVFLMNPRIVSFFNPPEGARHVFMGLPLACLGVVFLGSAIIQSMARSASARRGTITLVLILVVSVSFYYEADRLARPEPYFGGPASLLWTGGGIPLADLVATRVEWPYRSEMANWEESRAAMQRALGEDRLRGQNGSEPYQWASLLVAVAGLMPALAAVVNGWAQHQKEPWLSRGSGAANAESLAQGG